MTISESAGQATQLSASVRHGQNMLTAVKGEFSKADGTAAALGQTFEKLAGLFDAAGATHQGEIAHWLAEKSDAIQIELQNIVHDLAAMVVGVDVLLARILELITKIHSLDSYSER